MESAMQSADDAEKRSAAADVDAAATEQTYIRLRDVFLLVAAGWGFGGQSLIRD
jgi:fatty acid desaturase